MKHLLILILLLGSVTVAQAQIDDSCPLCIESPPAGTFSERHYQRQQRTPSFTAPTLPSYDRGYTPGQNQYRHSLDRYAPKPVQQSRGASYMWDTPERQMQQESLAIQEYNAAYGSNGQFPSRSTCDSWSLDGC